MNPEINVLCHSVPGYEIVGETASDTMMYLSAPVLNSRISLPKMRTLGADVNYIKFNSYYSNLASRLRNKARLEMYPAAVDDYEARAAAEPGAPPAPFFEHSLSVSYESALVSAQICSIIVTEGVYTGGANGYEEMSAQNWLASTGQIMKAKDLFKPICNWQGIILAQIFNQAQSRGEELGLYEDWKELLKQYLDWDNFYLTATDFNIFYPLFTVAPHSSGIVVFSVPLAKLVYCIRNEFLRAVPAGCGCGGCGCAKCRGDGYEDIIPPFELPPLYR